MKKKYIGKGDPLSLIKDKIYDVISVERGWYRIVDETGEDYLYPPKFFVDPDDSGNIDMTVSDYVQSILLPIEDK